MPSNCQEELLKNAKVFTVGVSIESIYNFVRRMSSNYAQRNPKAFDMDAVNKGMLEFQPAGDRIGRDILNQGGRELLQVFSGYQRQLLEEVADTEPKNIVSSTQTLDYTWSNPLDGSIVLVREVVVNWVSGTGDVQFVINGDSIGSPVGLSSSNKVSAENTQGANETVETVEVVVTNSVNLNYTLTVNVIKFTDYVPGIVPPTPDKPKIQSMVYVANLHDSYSDKNIYQSLINSITIKHIGGQGTIRLFVNDTQLGDEYLLTGGERYEDLRGANEAVKNYSVAVDNATAGFLYSITLDTEAGQLALPRYEYDSAINPGLIIYRWEDLDNRDEDDKRDYTSKTVRDIRIDTNNVFNIETNVIIALQRYMLAHFYDYYIGLPDLAIYQNNEYIDARGGVKYWLNFRAGGGRGGYKGYGV